MDLSLFTRFDGRINRQKWWLGLIALMIVQWIVYAVLMIVFGGSMMNVNPDDPAAMEQMMSSMTVPMIVLLLIFLWPSLALYAKRWHDRGKSGWWTLIVFVPIIGAIWALVELGFLAGTEGPNQYGPDPLAG